MDKFKNAEGIEYTIIWRKPNKNDLQGLRAKSADGLCDSPMYENPKILINPDVSSYRRFLITAEEFFHAHMFDATEKKARKFAKNLAQFVYKNKKLFFN